MRFRSYQKLRDCLKSESGISAVEFALIAPLMAMIYFGCIELSLMESYFSQAEEAVT